MTCTDETAWRTKVSAEPRHAMGHFAAGVTVISWVGADGGPVGTTANAVSSLCLDPPPMLVCFDLAGQTVDAVRAHGAFAINVLAAAQREAGSVGQLRAPEDNRGLGRCAVLARADRRPAAARRADHGGMRGRAQAAGRRVRDRLGWVCDVETGAEVWTVVIPAMRKYMKCSCIVAL
jgi:Flavin reductase like domain